MMRLTGQIFLSSGLRRMYAAPPQAAKAPKDDVFGSLYERLGGAAAVDLAVDKFYDKVLADPRINYFFDKTDMSVQRNHQKKFLTYAFGGPAEYSGKDMREAHRRMVKHQGLNATHFDAVVEHLGATLKELGVDPKLIAEAAAIAETTRADVLGH